MESEVTRSQLGLSTTYSAVDPDNDAFDPRIRRTQTLTTEKPARHPGYQQDKKMEDLLKILTNSFECIKTDQNRLLELVGDIDHRVRSIETNVGAIRNHQLTLFPLEN